MIIATTDLGIWILIALLGIALIISSLSIVIIQQGNKYVIERFGVYSRTLDAGIHYIVPFIDRIKNKVELQEQSIKLTSQAFTTNDNITVQIDATVVFMVIDVKLYSYGVKSPQKAIEEATSTTLRSLMWDLKLEEAFASRNDINTKMTNNLDETTSRWGIKIVRVEVTSIIEAKEIS